MLMNMIYIKKNTYRFRWSTRPFICLAYFVLHAACMGCEQKVKNDPSSEIGSRLETKGRGCQGSNISEWLISWSDDRP